MKKELLLKTKENIMNRYFLFMLFVVLEIFLASSRSHAQGVQTIQVGTTNRQMLVFASGVTPGRPLVISMHGLNQTMHSQYQSDFNSVAAANNFVLVYPQALNNAWQLSGTTDINFILAIIDHMHATYGIDRDRVYLHGFSMGGMMSYYAVTHIADKIAAIGPVGGFLMSGPNTNSSQPVPLMHVHGADDNFVPHNNVMTHMNAWVTRNGCPADPQQLMPYQPASNSTMYYWGPCEDGVEVVFVSLTGVGHWYSNDPVHTSREIWKFFNKYSLKYGPKFHSASVTDSNPKEIKVMLNAPVADAGYFNGFTVKVDGVEVTIDSVKLTGSAQLSVFLSDNLLNTHDDITISYNNGNALTASGKELYPFTDMLVENLLTGSSPRVIEISTNQTGDSVLIRFNKKMQLPSDISDIILNADYNGPMNINITEVSFFNNDSTILALFVDTQLYRDYELSLTYSGTNIASADAGILKTFTDFPVTNIADGLPVQLISARIKSDGVTLSLEFQKPMTLQTGQASQFIFNVPGKTVTIKSYAFVNNNIEFTLSRSIHYGDVADISYSPGTVKAADNGPLEGFSNISVTNQVNAPVWRQIPGKVEAEHFAFKFGMQTEPTGDTGGGLNLGHISDGHWVEYTIENNTSLTDFEIAFRLAAPSAGGKISYYLDDIYLGLVNCPVTGNWQVYESVVKNISIPPGKHYFKLVATKAGFNLNYFEVTESITGTEKEIKGENNILIYPNPSSGELIINSPDFKYSRIDILDASGNKVFSRSAAGETVLHFPVHLPDGVYFVRLSNEKQYQLKKIVITN